MGFKRGLVDSVELENLEGDSTKEGEKRFVKAEVALQRSQYFGLLIYLRYKKC
jgi:hypothetical protein